MRLTTSLPLFGLRPRVWLNHPGQLRLRELKATRSLVALEHALLRHIYFCFEFLYLCVCPTYKVVVLSISLLLVSFVAEMKMLGVWWHLRDSIYVQTGITRS